MMGLESIYWHSERINDANRSYTDAKCCVGDTDRTCGPGIALAYFSGDYTGISPDYRGSRNMLESHLVQLTTAPRHTETDRKGAGDQASGVVVEAGGTKGDNCSGRGVCDADDSTVEGEPFQQDFEQNDA